MRSALLLLLGCAGEPASWTVPTPPVDPPAPGPGLERTEVVDRWGPPTSLHVTEAGLLWTTGGAVHLGDRVADTAGWAADAADDGARIVVADGSHGLVALDRETLAPLGPVAAGTAVSMRDGRALFREGRVADLRTGAVTEIDGALPVTVRTCGRRWAVSALDGGLTLGGDGPPRLVRIRARSAACAGTGWVVWDAVGALVDLDGNTLATGVTGLAGTDPPAWSTAGEVRRLGTDAPLRARTDATVVLLEPAPDDGVLVAWSDGAIERLDAAGAVIDRARFEVAAPDPGSPVRSDALQALPGGLGRTRFGDVIALPLGVPAERWSAGGGWSIGMHRLLGAVVAIHDDGRVVRRLLPGQANDAVVVGDTLVVALGLRGAAAVRLDDPAAPAEVLELSEAPWTSLCTDGARAVITLEEDGLALLEATPDGLRVVDRADTPGRARYCDWTPAGVEVWETTGRVRVRFGR